MSGNKCVFTATVEGYPDDEGNPFTSVFSYTTGIIQEKIVANIAKKANPLDQELRLISDICVSWDGGPGISAAKLGELDITFLNDLRESLDEVNYGCNYSPEIACYECGTPSRHSVDVLDFLTVGSKSTAS
jgi:hypothetical protein